MNILPIVFTFILIFSFLTFSFLRQSQMCIISEKSIESVHKISRAVLNNLVQKKYNQIKCSTEAAASNQIPPGGKREKAKEPYHSRRERFPPLEASKLNILPLCEAQTDPKKHPLYEISAQLLRLLYGESLFKQSNKEHVEYQLLNALIQQYRTKTDTKQLTDLYPDDAELKRLFYKMLKGTNQYNRDVGIPPLGDFLRLDKQAAIYFSYSSSALLEALLGEKNALKVLAEEKKKYEETGKNKSLSQDELFALLTSDAQHISLLLALGNQLDFSKASFGPSSLGGKDKKSGLTVRKNASQVGQ